MKIILQKIDIILPAIILGAIVLVNCAGTTELPDKSSLPILKDITVDKPYGSDILSLAENENQVTGKEIQDEPSGSHDHTANPVYFCPMHKHITSDKPGKCPICGMALRAKESTTEEKGNSEHNHE